MTEQSQTLYRKWRSQTFGDLIGQEAITHTLRQAVLNERLAHAYLFCGPRGTGKTSTARLLAKMINCPNRRDGEPCNNCASCREITQGRSTDVFEIDAASNRGIDEIRELRERVLIASAVGRTRVYLVDEIHMLTDAAFNALLKTLEEPPPRVLFVLATTEVHKVPATVASRCQRFDFRRIGLADIMRHLDYVATQEGMQADRGALELIARAAQGGMRDALSLLDQARAFGGNTLTAEAARTMLGMADPSLVRDLVSFVAQADTAAGLHRIHDLALAGVDLRQLTGQIGELWRQLMLTRAGADVVTLLDLAPEDAASLRQLAAPFALETLTECARIFARNDVGPHTQIIPQLALELAFLDCVAAARAPTSRNEAIADAPAAYQTPPRPVVATSVAPPPVAAPIEPPAATPRLSIVAQPQAATPPATATPAPPAAAPPQSAAPAPIERNDLAAQISAQWEMIRKLCKQRSVKLYGMLNNAHCSRVDVGEQIEVVIGVEFDVHLNHMSQPQNRLIIEWAMQQALEITCQTSYILEKQLPQRAPREPAPFHPGALPLPSSGPESNETGAQTAVPTTPARTPIQLAESDAVVLALKREFGGTVLGVQRHPHGGLSD